MGDRIEKDAEEDSYRGGVFKITEAESQIDADALSL